MLAITDNAVQAIDAIVSQPGLPDDAGLRISSAPDDAGIEGQQTALRLAVVESPEESDRVVEGAPVFVESDTAEFLDDKLLDAEVESGQVQFMLREQEAAA